MVFSVYVEHFRHFQYTSFEYKSTEMTKLPLESNSSTEDAGLYDSGSRKIQNVPAALFIQH